MPDTFATLVADPNWGFENFGCKKHGAARGHYSGSAVEVLGEIPVASWARPDSILFLWASLTKTDCAVDVMRSWGFSWVTSWPWIKTAPSKAELAKGIGFWTHATAELLIVCRKGKAKGPKQKRSKKVDGLLTGPKDHPVFWARRGPHSRKPLSLIEWIESRLPGPYLELFARTTRPGWTSWGHETGYHLCKEGVRKLDRCLGTTRAGKQCSFYPTHGTRCGHHARLKLAEPIKQALALNEIAREYHKEHHDRHKVPRRSS